MDVTLLSSKLNNDGTRTVFVMAANKPDAVHPVTNQPAGATCTTPSFGPDSIALFFVCAQNGQNTTLSLQTSKAWIPSTVNVQNPNNPAPGSGQYLPRILMMGQWFTMARRQAVTRHPMIRLEGLQVSNIRWVTLADLQQAEG